MRHSAVPTPMPIAVHLALLAVGYPVGFPHETLVLPWRSSAGMLYRHGVRATEVRGPAWTYQSSSRRINT